MIGAPIVGPDVRAWAQEMVRYLGRAVVNLQYLNASSSATVDGILMWNPATSGVVVSIGGAWVAVGGGVGATNLGYTAATRQLTSSTGTGTTLPLVATDAGLMSAADKTKLDAITGTNTGNQTSIVGITGTLAEFNAALTGADFVSGGGTATGANTGDQTITLTGDVTGTGAGSFAATLATVNANVGSFGLAGSVAQFVVNAKGLITSAVNVAISIASTAISDSTAAGRAMLTALTATAQTALLDVFTSGAKGLAPASGGGTINFLRADATWATPAGGTSGLATVTVPNGVFEWSETVAAVGVAAGQRIMVTLADHADGDENSADMLWVLGLSGRAAAAQIGFDMQFGEPTGGPIKLNWSAA